ELWGLAFCSSRIASKLPVWGSLKLSVNALPAAEWIPTSATSPTTQPNRASHLCLKHQEATFLITTLTLRSCCALRLGPRDPRRKWPEAEMSYDNCHDPAARCAQPPIPIEHMFADIWLTTCNRGRK